MPVQQNSEPRPLVHMEGRQETPVGESCISFFIWYAQENKLRYGIIRQDRQHMPAPSARQGQRQSQGNYLSMPHKKYQGLILQGAKVRRLPVNANTNLSVFPCKYLMSFGDSNVRHNCEGLQG